jgi:hypothetical protein
LLRKICLNIAILLVIGLCLSVVWSYYLISQRQIASTVEKYSSKFTPSASIRQESVKRALRLIDKDMFRDQPYMKSREELRQLQEEKGILSKELETIQDKLKESPGKEKEMGVEETLNYLKNLENLGERIEENGKSFKKVTSKINDLYETASLSSSFKHLVGTTIYYSLGNSDIRGWHPRPLYHPGKMLSDEKRSYRSAIALSIKSMERSLLIFRQLFETSGVVFFESVPRVSSYREPYSESLVSVEHNTAALKLFYTFIQMEKLKKIIKYEVVPPLDSPIGLGAYLKWFYRDQVSLITSQVDAIIEWGEGFQNQVYRDLEIYSISDINRMFIDSGVVVGISAEFDDDSQVTRYVIPVSETEEALVLTQEELDEVFKVLRGN